MAILTDIERMEAELIKMASRLGEVAAERDKYRKMYEEVLGALRFSSEKVGRLIEELAEFKGKP